MSIRKIPKNLQFTKNKHKNDAILQKKGISKVTDFSGFYFLTIIHDNDIFHKKPDYFCKLSNPLAF